MERYRSLYGIDQYSVYTVDTRELPGVIYRGKPADYGVRVALAKVGHWQLELLEPLRGDSMYQDFLNEHGEGVQHLGFFVDNYGEAYQEMVDRGFPHLLGGPILGKTRNGRFDYFDSKKDLGVVVELLDIPDAKL
jgi:4-hydroxyphenylpyruvate dioxygenase-like putative hemolysin